MFCYNNNNNNKKFFVTFSIKTNENNFINDYQKSFHEKNNKNYILYLVKKISIILKYVLL